MAKLSKQAPISLIKVKHLESEFKKDVEIDFSIAIKASTNALLSVKNRKIPLVED